jgi:TRAP-type C4-dicarboxylate transport system substrate-binding protein
MSRIAVAASVAALSAAFAFAAPARAENFNITMVSGHGTHLPWIRAIHEFYIPEVNKRLAAAPGKHTIKWQEAYGGTIVKITGELQAVRNGVAEMAHVYTIFEPANLPLLQVTHVTPFSVPSVSVLTKVMVDMNHEVKALRDQWSKQNQVFLGAVVADSIQLYTKKPVSRIDELKGLKVGASGSLSLWANGIGMVPVQGDFSTHYNNLKTGVYDSLLAFVTGTFPIKVHEVAPYVIRIDSGATSIGAITINKALFDSMPREVQKVLVEVGDEYSGRVAATLEKLVSTFEANMVKQGATISELSQAERAKWANTMPNIAQDWVKRNEERGLPAGAVLKTYLAKLRAAGQKPLRDWEKP